MKKLLLETFVLAVASFLFSFTVWAAGAPSEGDKESLEKKTIENVTLTTANLPNGLSYRDSKGDGGVFRGLTAIYPPPKTSIKDIVNKKIPVNVRYSNTRTYTGKAWKHDNIVELSLTGKISKDAKPAKKKSSRK